MPLVCWLARPNRQIGIIGGTGLEKTNFLENVREITVDTPYGQPSDVLIEGTVGSVSCVILPRHGRRHQFSPTNVNYRANMWALMKSGVNIIIACTASGSLREEIAPGHFVVLDSFIDRTTKREQTFYDGQPGHPSGVAHVPMHPVFNQKLREVIMETCEELNITHHKRGTAVCIEGPRFSSRAESEMFRLWGGDIVNMTICPEAVLAKELGIPYVSTALATDYDCWREGDHVSVELVLKTLADNASSATKLFMRAIEKVAKMDWSDEIKEAKAVARFSIMGIVEEEVPHLL
ncbi:hypothetical protein QR680_000472 [Steinernema hermaphroditum]|uniref:S-methyl-5'-thioadenosine phosphorylase n=1 Tax=Steinernema hermaphroditum TaxID=289476 RepID=A0AA39GWP8_9BILA|nr:hypothetical protein QR680_000472 [Steinernema hermaphroditum]